MVIDSILVFFASILAVCFCYIMRFTQTTLAMGKELSITESERGMQDAITPPKFSNIALLIYGSIFFFMVFIFSTKGWIWGLGSIAYIFMGSAIFGLLMPKGNSEHFKNIIRNSMMNRYANYKKEGDEMRANAMESLLDLAGISVPEELKKDR